MARLPAIDTLPASCLRVLGVLLQAQQDGYLTPTLREIADTLAISLESVRFMLVRLRMHGLVTWEPERKRTLRLTCRFFEI